MDSYADDSRPPRAVLFDAYGTLFDVSSVLVTAEALFPGRGERLTELWREKQLEYSRLVSMSGRYQPFSALTLAALRWSAERLGLALSEAAERGLMTQYQALTPFPENLSVLGELKSRGVRCGVLSNGDPEMLAAVVARAGFNGLLEPLISVQQAQRYKTDPAAYKLGVDALALPAREILFVSSNCWDAIGATWFGYTTLWVNRANAPVERLDVTPHHLGNSLRSVLDCLAPPD